MDVARAELVESELDAMIRRRHDRREAEEEHRPSEEMYEQSCRRHAEQQREELRAEWRAYHQAAAERARRTLTAIAERHEAAAAMLDDQDRRTV